MSQEKSEEIDIAIRIIKELEKYQEELDDDSVIESGRLREITADLCFSLSQIYKNIIKSRIESKEKIAEFEKKLNEDDTYKPSLLPVDVMFYL